jgi:hypothetical protein
MTEQDSWNPITDDADALRLAVKLEIFVEASTARAQLFGEFA